MQIEQIEPRLPISDAELEIKMRIQNMMLQASYSCRQTVIDSSMDSKMVDYIVKLIDDDIKAIQAL